MADSKITALTALTAADPVNDMFPVVDVSDTTMAASGTTKKISINNILGASGTATLASATITGAATVGTTLGVTGVSTLASANVTNNLGVGGAINYTGAGEFYLQNSAGTNFIGINATSNYIRFATNNAIKASIDSSGNFNVQSGNVVMTTSGKGIDFSATANSSGTMTSELLNDYEEGTFTPSIGGTATYTLQNGRYVKIGNRVYVTLRLTILLRGTGSTSAISGIPFAVGASSPICSVSIGYFADLAISINYISAYANSSSITLTGTTSATTSVTNSVAVIGNGTDIAMSFFYEV